MRLLLFLLIAATLSHAEELAVPGARPDLDSFFPVPTDTRRGKVFTELECIQFRIQDNKHQYKTRQASDMIKHLSPHFEDAFKRFKIKGIERAFFYAQALEESSGLTILSETKNMKAIGHSPMQALVADVMNDKAFEEKSGAKTSDQFGHYRGRGPLQISRCDNFASVIHYLNQMYYKKSETPVWQGYWEYENNGQKKKLSTVCKPEEIQQFSDWYRLKKRMNPNLYGALENPSHFSMIDGELIDPVTKKKMPSERFMLDSTMAFWRGHCGDLVDNAISFEAIKTYGPCKAFADADYLVHATKCITHCVKGSTEGWEKRLKWMKEAMLCSRL